MIPATAPITRAADARLLVVDEEGVITHHARSDFPRLVRAGDVVAANDAATLPATLFGIHEPTGGAVEVRLAGRDSLSPKRVRRFRAVVFGAGDFRTPTEHRARPPALHPGDALRLGPLHALVAGVLAHSSPPAFDYVETRKAGHHQSGPALIDIEFQNPIPEIWEGLARHGRPIQYAYIPQPLAIWDTWTRIASQPVAFEPPSAGFLLDWAMIHSLRRRGANFATVTLAAGISSTGDPALDRLLPFDEPYFIPASTVDAIDACRRQGGRVIAIGTTVVRALEHAVASDGTLRAGAGVATERIGPLTQLRVVNAIVSGTHEPGTSHYELLLAFQADEALVRMDLEAESMGYRTHEFGDSVLLERNPARQVTNLSLNSSGPLVRKSA